ncbi:preprotein translocase subunit YajC [Calorimonas adulescens]|jgi:protein translocase subunit yajC|uniref:Preprotein translocase subunit YajC n=1 Tax=Calorimonas adulescens TaxID=2606906 RepID=A0A5D8QI21_9THEO|nr:preprotein translocase subunit YajC [Calorimonas adulescens]TZE83516.1 preprotein translocase subunit YajC [Calorimonas adulescens]
MNQTMVLIIELVVFVGIFYLLIILPQQQRDKKEKEMLASLTPGDEIITKSGIYGKILNIKDDAVTIEVGADKVKLKIAKWAVGGILNKAPSKENKVEKEDKKEGNNQ